MAEDEDTSELEAGKRTFTERELRQRELADLRERDDAQRARHEEEIRRRDHAGIAFGRRILEAVARRLRRYDDGAYPREQELVLDYRRLVSGQRVSIEHAPRPKAWKGPADGKVFSDAKELEAATLRECSAGYVATWGHELTDASRKVALVVVRGMPAVAHQREAQAREIYSSLRNAMESAKAFAKANYNQAHGAATCALDAAWEGLPSLPALEELPGYVKAESEHARLVRHWQDLARRTLGWELRRRELAELSILLGIGPIPYKRIINDSGKMDKRKHIASVSDVIEWEANNLDRSLRSLRDAGT